MGRPPEDWEIVEEHLVISLNPYLYHAVKGRAVTGYPRGTVCGLPRTPRHWDEAHHYNPGGHSGLRACPACRRILDV